MKKVLFALLPLLMILAVACQRDPEVVQRTREQDLLGKWMLQRGVEETYSPATTLINSDEYIGEPGDSIVFRPNNILYSYSGPDREETEYRLVNDSILLIEQEQWKIRTLNERELTLVQDETFMDERYIIRLFLVR